MSMTTSRAAAITLAMTSLLRVPALADGHGGHPPQAGVTSLDVYADGDTLHLLVAERTGSDPARLHHRRSEDGGRTWSEPVPLGDGQVPPDPAHRGQDVQLAAASDRLIAAWPTHGTGAYGGGPIATAISDDGGRSWAAGPNPADDGSTDGHSFIDIAADPGGAFHLVWLDSRDGMQGLRYARSTDGGRSWSANRTLDAETCECCWNAISVGPGGAVAVLYRDKDPRDMAVVRSLDEGTTWSWPAAVGEFGWQIEGCPHVGGGLSLAPGDDRPAVHAVVWTGQEGRRGAYHVRSADGGRTWGDPTPLGDPGAWRADLAASGRRVAVAWDAPVEGGQAVFAAASSDGGRTWTEPRRQSQAGAFASHPRVVPTATGFRVFWTEKAEGTPTSWASRPLDAR